MAASALANCFVADLHIHSRYSRACSRDLDLRSLGWWARRKGIGLLATGDFTHPAWRQHLRESLVPAEPGLFRLEPELEREVLRTLPPRLGSRTDDSATRFILEVEISTIYKRDDRTRKVHHLVYLPDFDSMERFCTALGRIGNLGSDGRPILGLDSRDLLDIAMSASDQAMLVPAHIWTPWFSALGSKSGFDSIADCYADLADHVFAVETGLSSDPAMNWRVSSLDRYRLVSSSDAHSAPMLGREATRFATELDYFSVSSAMRTGIGLAGTIEFFPEEGKYHADGHRACGVNWDPQRTREAGGLCPSCAKPLTVGVLHRVEELADRPVGHRPADPAQVHHLIPLAEIVGEINQVGPKSKRVQSELNTLVAALGSELNILMDADPDEVAKVGGPLLGEAITRLRAGRVNRTSGFDGEYGVIRLFEPEELAKGPTTDALFEVPQQQPRPQRPATRPAKGAAPAAATPQRRRPQRGPKQAPPPITPLASPHEPFEPMLAGMEEVGTGLLDRLDALQRVAASAPGGPLLIVAGPGTGKTRTLTHRIAYLCAEMDVYPEECLAITFTRRAAEELRERLDGLLGPVGEDVTVSTFHALGLSIIRDNLKLFGLTEDFGIAEGDDRLTATEPAQRAKQVAALRKRDLIDLDELVTAPLAVLRKRPKLAERYRSRWPWIFVDEYQDVDKDQYDLLRLLCPPGGNICVIGDPDQAIYSFRGAEVGFFLRFSEEFGTREVDARVVRLTRNYRSAAPIVAAAVQAITPGTLVPGRRLDPARLDPDSALIGRYQAASPSDEADFVVRTIDELVGGLSHRSHDSGRVDSRTAGDSAVSFSDIAVLYRTDAQSGVILDALSRAGVPAQKRSHNRLLDRPGVAALARQMRFAEPAQGGSGTAAGAPAPTRSEATGDQGDLVVQRLRRDGLALAQRCDQPTLDESEHALSSTDIHVAVELLAPLAQRCHDDFEAFFTALATGAEVDALDPRADAVTLLTLHASKGLEFPVVFLVGCEDGLLPLRLPGRPPSDEDVAEERRLFFVGLTRAKDRLFVSHARKRSRHGNQRDVFASPFLDPIDPGLLEQRWQDAPRRPKDRQLRLL